METNQPKVTLINWTPRPLETFAYECGVYKNIAPPSIDEMLEKNFPEPNREQKLRDFVEPFTRDPTAIGLEFIQLIFLIENASRAYQQQITRHRMCSFIIQSLRVFDMGKFADEGRYTMPSTVKDKEAYFFEMRSIQNKYNDAVASGELMEDARGLLPLNVHSTITMRTDFNNLRHICRGRLCIVAQEEARLFAYEMKREVTEKMGSFFGDLLQPPCHQRYGGKCTNVPNYCGVPIWLASTNPPAFLRWYERTGGKPKGRKGMIETHMLPQDIEQAEIALDEARKKTHDTIPSAVNT